MPSSCCVPNCRSNYTKKSPKVSVYQFPRDENAKRAWLSAINREDFVPTKYSKVCAKHFSDDQFATFREAFNDRTGELIQVQLEHRRLIPGAIPSLFPNSSEPSNSRENLEDKAEITVPFGLKDVTVSLQEQVEKERLEKIPTVQEPYKILKSQKPDYLKVISNKSAIILLPVDANQESKNSGTFAKVEEKKDHTLLEIPVKIEELVDSTPIPSISNDVGNQAFILTQEDSSWIIANSVKEPQSSLSFACLASPYESGTYDRDELNPTSSNECRQPILGDAVLASTNYSEMLPKSPAMFSTTGSSKESHKDIPIKEKPVDYIANPCTSTYVANQEFILHQEKHSWTTSNSVAESQFMLPVASVASSNAPETSNSGPPKKKRKVILKKEITLVSPTTNDPELVPQNPLYSFGENSTQGLSKDASIKIKEPMDYNSILSIFNDAANQDFDFPQERNSRTTSNFVVESQFASSVANAASSYEPETSDCDQLRKKQKSNPSNSSEGLNPIIGEGLQRPRNCSKARSQGPVCNSEESSTPNPSKKSHIDVPVRNEEHVDYISNPCASNDIASQEFVLSKEKSSWTAPNLVTEPQFTFSVATLANSNAPETSNNEQVKKQKIISTEKTTFVPPAKNDPELTPKSSVDKFDESTTPDSSSIESHMNIAVKIKEEPMDYISNPCASNDVVSKKFVLSQEKSSWTTPNLVTEPQFMLSVASLASSDAPDRSNNNEQVINSTEKTTFVPLKTKNSELVPRNPVHNFDKSSTPGPSNESHMDITVKIKEEPMDYISNPCASNDVANEEFSLPQEKNSCATVNSVEEPHFTLTTTSLASSNAPETSNNEQVKKRKINSTEKTTFVPPLINDSELTQKSSVDKFDESTTSDSSNESHNDIPVKIKHGKQSMDCISNPCASNDVASQKFILSQEENSYITANLVTEPQFMLSVASLASSDAPDRSNNNEQVINSTEKTTFVPQKTNNSELVPRNPVHNFDKSSTPGPTNESHMDITVKIKEEPMDYISNPFVSNDVADQEFNLPQEKNSCATVNSIEEPQCILPIANLVSPYAPETSDSEELKKKRKTKKTTFVPPVTNNPELTPDSSVHNFNESSTSVSSNESHMGIPVKIKEEPMDYMANPCASNDVANQEFSLPQEKNSYITANSVEEPHFNLTFASLASSNAPKTFDHEQPKKNSKTNSTEKTTCVLPVINDLKLVPKSPVYNFEESMTQSLLKEPHKDQFDVFGEFIAAKLRSFDRKSCAFAQKAIADIIFEADMGKYLKEGHNQPQIAEA
ncbi:uncharacterized protein LOC129975640 [Argiope bruennichi]|uniref:uncharacterized protein LOC129975640 n=1 Tax=Argiope bruennichi TaxID=94029 RepID=UPI0024949ADA|nr:uncharacterized protein LOC129975640 [Argiope bruennichi]